MTIKIPARFLAPTWDMATWDAAYNIIIRAGKGEEMSTKFLADLKTGAAAGNVHAVRVKTNFDAVAKLVIKDLPRPSVFVRQRRGRTSPLLPGGSGAPTARGASQPLAATVNKQAQKLVELKRQQLERARRERLAKQAQQRVATLKTEHDAQRQELEAELELLKRQLERRDLAAEVRAKLEAQATQYEARIEELERGATSAEPAPAPITEATAAERVEAEQDDAAAAYPSAAPGDVEFNDAANG